MKQLCLGALPLEPEARERYLREHCPDPELRREVEELIAAESTLTVGPLSGGGVTQALVPGSLLGHYRIQHPLGAGGMGQVYEAADQKLHRTVAIKILPPGDTDEEARRRLLREAQAASALNHPNIVTVYEVGSEGGTDFIAMERITGHTLSQVIGEKGLDTRTAIAYAVQIADALAAAHESGVVHRDLKPGNIMVTERGLIKVLDFGLAKQIARIPGTDLTEESLSKAGLVMGTCSYLAPERASGKPVDSRSDIFSFGAVFYEMLTGRKAFHEDTGIETISAILYKEPAPLEEMAPASPGELHRVIMKCLQKKLYERWQHILDVKFVLEDLARDLDAPADSTVAAGRLAGRFGWLAAAIAACAGVLVTAGAFRFLRAPVLPAPEPIYRMLTAAPGLNDYPAISRDGKFVAYSSDRSGEGNLDIWLQQIGGRDPIRLTKGPADETDPCFSPDGTKIAFRSERNGGGIYVVPTLGGEPVLLAPEGRSPRFSQDGKWVAFWTGRGPTTPGSRVFIVEAGGGQPRPVHPEMASARFPLWSPAGDRLLVLGWKDAVDVRDWWVLPIEGGKVIKTGVLPQLAAQNLTRPQPGLRVEQTPLDWQDSGGSRILFAAPLGDSADLWEIGLAARGTASGPARRMTSGPGRDVHAARTITAESDRVVFSEEALTYSVWMIPLDPRSGAATGEMQKVTDGGSVEWAPSITSDGRQIVYLARRYGTWTVVSKDLGIGGETTLLSAPSLLLNARISGDGRRVVYSDTEYHLSVIPSSGGAVDKVCERCGTVMGVSNDGRYITYEPVKNEDVLVYDTGERKTFTLAPRPNSDTLLTGARISPDGKWISFHSIHNLTMAGQVWIAPLDRNRPAPPAEWIAITDGKMFGWNPCWALGGDLLYFVSERDGFPCIWAQRLNPATKRPRGDPFPVRHFHTARQSLRSVGVTGYLMGLSSGGNRLVFSFGELTANLWLEERPRQK